MGNTCHCCIFGCPRRNKILPIDLPDLIDDDSKNDLECIASLPSSTARLNKSNVTTKRNSLVKKSCEKEDKQHAKQDEEMEYWRLSVIESQNTTPTFGNVIFSNKRHLAMREHFSDTIHKMAHSPIILEDKERDPRTHTSLSIHGNLKSWQPTTFNTQHKINIEPARGKTKTHYPKWLKQISSVIPKETTSPSKLGTMGKNASNVSNTVDKQLWHIAAEKTQREKNDNRTCSEPREKASTICNNWFDEDFKEAILADPVVMRGIETPEGHRGTKLEDTVQSLQEHERCGEMPREYQESPTTASEARSSELFMSLECDEIGTAHKPRERKTWFNDILKKRNTTSTVYNYSDKT